MVLGQDTWRERLAAQLLERARVEGVQPLGSAQTLHPVDSFGRASISTTMAVNGWQTVKVTG